MQTTFNNYPPKLNLWSGAQAVVDQVNLKNNLNVCVLAVLTGASHSLYDGFCECGRIYSSSLFLGHSLAPSDPSPRIDNISHLSCGFPGLTMGLYLSYF